MDMVIEIAQGVLIERAVRQINSEIKGIQTSIEEGPDQSDYIRGLEKAREIIKNSIY